LEGRDGDSDVDDLVGELPYTVAWLGEDLFSFLFLLFFFASGASEFSSVGSAELSGKSWKGGPINFWESLVPAML